jgi:CheY-like chemotaxis protein
MNKSVIFVVDDEEILRELLGEVLRDEGYEVYEFVDGQKALMEASVRFEKKLKIDLVLTDVNMPEMSGLKLTEELRKLEFKNPIILLSGESGDDFEALKSKPGVSGVQPKPYNTNALLESIANYIKQTS